VRARRFRILIAISGIAVACVLLWALVRANSPREVRLRDGRTLVIRQVSYGTEHEFLYGTPWYRMVAAVTPPRWRQKLPLRIFRNKSAEPALVVWGEWRLPGTPRVAPNGLSISETNWNQRFRVYGGTSTVSSNRVLMFWSLENFPRRSSALEFDLEEWSSSRWIKVGTLRLPNPARHRFPKWRPKAFPASRVTNGIEVFVENMIPGSFISSPWVTTTPRMELSTGFAALFQVREGGQVSRQWQVAGMRVRDATGNHVSSRAISTSFSVGDHILAGVEGPLWPGEPAWSLSAEFVRAGNYPSNELCTLTNIPLPSVGSVTQVLASARANGRDVIGVELQWRGRSPGPFRQPQDVEIEPLLPVIEPGDYVCLAEVRDDAGRRLRFERSHYSIEPFHYGIELLPDSKTLDLTFAMERKVQVEWKIKIR